MGTSVVTDRLDARPEAHAGTGRPLRLCYFCNDYPVFTGGKSGGIGTHTHALVNAISALGHDVTVIANAPTRATITEGRVTIQGVPLRGLRQWKLGRLLPVNWLRWSFAANRTLRELHAAKPFDLVSLPDAYGEGFGFALRPFLPSVVRLGGPASIVQQWDARARPFVRAAVEYRIERVPVARATLTVCASRPFAEFINREWNLQPSKTRFIRNPLDLRRFVPRAHPGEQANPLVLFTGHVQPLKGVQDLVDAVPQVASEIAGVRFRIVGNDTRTGPGMSSFQAHLERCLRDSGAADRVDFVPTVPQVELVTMYQQCSVFVLPSRNDVYPNAVLEAMGCGRPCIVTSTTGVAELIEKADCGRVVPPDNPAALAAAIAEILHMPLEAREAMGGRARRVVESLCAPDVIGRQAVDVYREAIALWPTGRTSRAGTVL